ncbi:hypothetical protein BP5796_09279 [Neofusicoccum parvum]|uniref:Uncharacterized protein n=1 Tax=Neofusicoccum parvum TaxID=310453 RepID=A0ACB5S1G7_9PEZI|nr:hypothetical protein BP5796_09279 [Neofusicoccum parvum]
MASSPDTTPSTLIVGAGCMGLSTALHLQRRGNANITLLDAQPFPSIDAASNDSSRIVRPDYTDPFYATLAREAHHAWLSDPVFTPSFHRTGWIMAELAGAGHVARTLAVLRRLGLTQLERLTPAACTARFAALDGPMPRWDMYFNADAGWADARGALRGAMAAFAAAGGRVVTGQAVALEMDAEDSARVAGVRTADGAVLTADRVLVCAGAGTPALLDTGALIHPVGLCVAHWRLDGAEERARWEGHPVVDLHRHGYFFPPNEEGVMKMGIGMLSYHNLPADGSGVSAPVRSLEIPKEAEECVRWILRQVAPSLAEKPFFDMKVCWDGITADHHWLISKHPEKTNLYVAAGGSGHAFKFFPIIGKYILDMMNGELGAEHAEKWRWRTGTGDVTDTMGGRKMKDLKTSLAQQ